MTGTPARRGAFLSPPSLVGLAVGLVPVGLWFAPPPGWTAQSARDLQAAIDKYRIE
jgi:hypothetical protein